MTGRRGLIAGAALLAFFPRAHAADGPLRVVSPPDGLRGLSDYPYWIARKQKYFGDLDTGLDAGPAEPMAGLKAVDRGLFEIGTAAPGA